MQEHRLTLGPQSFQSDSRGSLNRSRSTIQVAEDLEEIDLSQKQESAAKSECNRLTRRDSEYALADSVLNPQPKFYTKVGQEEPKYFDPLVEKSSEDTWEEVAVFEDLYPDDFDYESLYPDIPSEGSENENEASAQATGDEGTEGREGGQSKSLPPKPLVAVRPEDIPECKARSNSSGVSAKAEHISVVRSILHKQQQRKRTKINRPAINKKSLEEYFNDQVELSLKQYTVEKVESYSESAEILQRKRAIAALDRRLDEERRKYRGLKDSFERRWEIARAKQQKFQEDFGKHSFHYKEQIDKREKAIRRIDTERTQMEEKEEEVSQYHEEIKCLKHIKAQEEKRLDKFKVFERYLDSVKEYSSGEFKDIREIVDRFGVLADARSTLFTRDFKSRQKYDRTQNAIHKTQKLMSNEVLVYNNYLSELRVYGDALQEDLLQLEELLLHIRVTAANRTLVIGRIKMAAYNLYHGLCIQLHQAVKIHPDDTFKQLKYITTSMKELIKLSKNVKHLLKSAAATAEKEATERRRAELKKKLREKFIPDSERTQSFLFRRAFQVESVQPLVETTKAPV